MSRRSHSRTGRVQVRGRVSRLPVLPVPVIPVPVEPAEAVRRGATEETSAGGLVINRIGGEVLVALIARRNRAGRVEWCLPKGHLEGSETPEQAAVREVQEETGIHGRVLDQVGVVDYWFTFAGRRVHKTVHHYLLEAVSGRISVVGDPDAEAFDAAWVPLGQLEQRLSFTNERRIARAAGVLLADDA